MHSQFLPFARLLVTALLFGQIACSDTAVPVGEAVDVPSGLVFDAKLGELAGDPDSAADTGADTGTDAAGTDAAAADVVADAGVLDGSSDSSSATTCLNAGSAWCPCKENADCDGSLCLDTPNGHVCAAKCVDQCPADFSCASVNSGGTDILTVCVPKWGWLCDPCSASADCNTPGNGSQAACLDYGNSGHFCGFDCTTTADCPGGYVCGTGKTTEGTTRKQCWFGSGTGSAATACGCSPRASSLQLATTCAVSASGVTCSGIRHCTASGLEPCSGKPGQEVCNGKDDDCDGKTDNGVCDDQNGCTQDLCDPISGKCSYNQLDGAPCNADNTFCTQNDSCQKGVCKPGSAKICTDGNVCTDDTCDPKNGCTYTDNGAACDDGKVCTSGDVCKNGTCSAGISSNCDDGNACTDQACDAKTGNCTTTFNSNNCDDGSACTQNDACSGGVCKAGTSVNCADNDACTLDSCDSSGGCKHTISTGVCDDGDACSYGETCASGACGGGANLQCDDLNPCTADSCDKISGCQHSAQNGACSDGNACTVSDVCSGGTCVGQSAGPCASDGNVCTDDVCDPAQGCIHTNNSNPCSDGSVCTQNDTCSGGTCQAGGALSCSSDGNPCTTESCDPISGCLSINNTASCSDGDGCTIGDVCSGGTCQKGAPKDCSSFSGTCATGKCASGSCYADPFPIETVCATGLCDGAGTCVTPGTYTVDGCTGTNYVNCTMWNCYGCKEENGFSAYNTTDCEGTGCFDRFPSFGVNGMVIMEAQWAETAYATWKFPQKLIGNYKIEAQIPVAIPASANGGACKADSTTTYAPKAVYHLQTAGNDLKTVTVNHQTAKGTKVTLFQGDATGVTSIRLGNGPTSPSPPACQFYLLDAIYATPY